MPERLTGCSSEKGEKNNDFERERRRDSCMLTDSPCPRRDRGDNLAGKLPYFVIEKSAQIRFVRSSSLGRPRASDP